MTIEWDYIGAVLLQWGLPLLPLFLLPIFFLKFPRDRWWAKILAVVATLISLCLLGLAAFFVDDVMPAPHSWPFCLSVLVLATAINGPLVARFRSKTGGVILTAFGVAVLVMNYGDSDLKAFKRTFAEIQEGMTEQQATLIMKSEFAAGAYTEPDFLHGEGGDSSVEYYFPHAPGGKMFNGGYEALIILKLKDGRVVSKRYLND